MHTDSFFRNRTSVLWVRGTYISLYRDYVTDQLAAHTAEVGYSVPSYSFWMRAKPFNIRKEKSQVCVCGRCLQQDLICAELKNMAVRHSKSKTACACGSHFRGFSSGRDARDAVLCPRATPTAASVHRPMHNIHCVRGKCSECGVSRRCKIADSCPVSPPATDGVTDSVDDAAEANSSAESRPPIVLCPSLFRDPKVRFFIVLVFSL